MKKILRTVYSIIIASAMLSITACGNTDNTSSAAPKATTTASSTEVSATTTTEATLTSQSEETTSLSATTTTSGTSNTSTSSGKSSTTTKGGSTAKANSSKASNGGTVNNDQSYSHNTSNNGSGNNSYSNGNNNSYQPQQTERQTERQTQRQTTTTTRQTTTTAKKTQAPKPKPTTTTAKPKPKFELTQNDIDRAVKELQQYSNEHCDFDAIFYNEQEMWDNIATRNLDNSSWGTPDTVSPDTYSSYDELYRKVKGHIDDLYRVIGKDQAHIVVYQQWHGDGSAINSDGKPAWEIYLLY